MSFSNVFECLDMLLKKWLKIGHEREKLYFETRQKAEGIKDILYDMDIIDTKSGALLTHISIMFVVLGFFLSSENHWLISIVLLIEFIGYLLVAMVLLRCIDIMDPPFRQLPTELEELKITYYTEVTLRREIYHRSVRAVYILTACLIPIVFFKYVL